MSTAVPAFAVALLVLGAPFFAAGSSRLADKSYPHRLRMPGGTRPIARSGGLTVASRQPRPLTADEGDLALESFGTRAARS